MRGDDAYGGMFVIQHGVETVILCTPTAARRLAAMHRDSRTLQQRLRPSRDRLRRLLRHDEAALNQLRRIWPTFGLPTAAPADGDAFIATVLEAVAGGRLLAIHAAAPPRTIPTEIDAAALQARLNGAEALPFFQPQSTGGTAEGWSVKAKIGAMLMGVPKHLSGDLLAAFQALVSDEGLEILAASIVVVAIGQELGHGEVVDAGLLGWAWWTAGRAGLVALADMLGSFVIAGRAKSDADVARAAALFAGALVALGISALTLLTMRAGRKPVGPKSLEGHLAEDGALDRDVEPLGIARPEHGFDAKQAAAQKAFDERSVTDNMSRKATLNSDRRKHILDGDATGGGHRAGTGSPKKSEFPATWSDAKVVDEVESVANDPTSTRSVQPNGRMRVEGTRDGVDIRVVIDRDGTTIWTAHPINVPVNP